MLKIVQSSPDMIVQLSGKIDSTNLNDIEVEAQELLETDDSIESLVFDINEVVYVSSAGLRVFSAVNKICKKRKIKYKVIGVRADILAIFKMTGYASIFPIEQKEE